MLADAARLLTQSTDSAGRFSEISQAGQAWDRVARFMLERYAHPLLLFLELKRAYYEQVCGVFVRRVEVQALHECYVRVVGAPSDYFKQQVKNILVDHLPITSASCVEDTFLTQL